MKTPQNKKNLQTIQIVREILDNFLIKVKELVEEDEIYQRLMKFKMEYISKLTETVYLAENLREKHFEGIETASEENSLVQSLTEKLNTLGEGDHEKTNKVKLFQDIARIKILNEKLVVT